MVQGPIGIEPRCSSGSDTAGDGCPSQGIGRRDLVVVAMGNMGMGKCLMSFLLTNFFSL